MTVEAKELTTEELREINNRILAGELAVVARINAGQEVKHPHVLVVAKDQYTNKYAVLCVGIANAKVNEQKWEQGDIVTITPSSQKQDCEELLNASGLVGTGAYLECDKIRGRDEMYRYKESSEVLQQVFAILRFAISDSRPDTTDRHGPTIAL